MQRKSVERLEAIQILRAKGWTYARIAPAIGVSLSRAKQLGQQATPPARQQHARKAQCAEASSAIDAYRREKARRLQAGKPVLPSSVPSPQASA